RFSRDWSSDVCSSDLFQYRYVFSACTGYPTVTVLALITSSLSAPISTVPTDTTQGHRYPPGGYTPPGASTPHTPACRESTGDDKIGRASCRERGGSWV